MKTQKTMRAKYKQERVAFIAQVPQCCLLACGIASCPDTRRPCTTQIHPPPALEMEKRYHETTRTAETNHPPTPLVLLMYLENRLACGHGRDNVVSRLRPQAPYRGNPSSKLSDHAPSSNLIPAILLPRFLQTYSNIIKAGTA